MAASPSILHTVGLSTGPQFVCLILLFSGELYAKEVRLLTCSKGGADFQYGSSISGWVSFVLVLFGVGSGSPFQVGSKLVSRYMLPYA